MYSVCIVDTMMVAHSLRGEIFGPAQRLHGATYVVEVTLYRDELDVHGIVADIGRARHLLAEVIEAFAYRNLDDLPEFDGRNTTTEMLAREIFDRYRAGLCAGRLGSDAASTVSALDVTLRETPNAWASYRGAVREESPDPADEPE